MCGWCGVWVVSVSVDDHPGWNKGGGLDTFCHCDSPVC
jgi:hypothetical protein